MKKKYFYWLFLLLVVQLGMFNNMCEAKITDGGQKIDLPSPQNNYGNINYNLLNDEIANKLLTKEEPLKFLNNLVTLNQGKVIIFKNYQDMILETGGVSSVSTGASNDVTYYLKNGGVNVQTGEVLNAKIRFYTSDGSPLNLTYNPNNPVSSISYPANWYVKAPIVWMELSVLKDTDQVVDNLNWLISSQVLIANEVFIVNNSDSPVLFNLERFSIPGAESEPASGATMSSDGYIIMGGTGSVGSYNPNIMHGNTGWSGGAIFENRSSIKFGIGASSYVQENSPFIPTWHVGFRKPGTTDTYINESKTLLELTNMGDSYTPASPHSVGIMFSALIPKKVIQYTSIDPVTNEKVLITPDTPVDTTPSSPIANKNFTVPKEGPKIPGYRFSQLKINGKLNLTGEDKFNFGYTYIEYQYVKTSTIKIDYCDEDGNKIADSEQLTGDVGTSYNLSDFTKYIAGYRLVAGPNNKGTFPDKDTTLTYHYKKINFCFKLERTKEELSLVKLILDGPLDGAYRSIDIDVPKHVTIDRVPTIWKRLSDEEDALTTRYRFNMGSANKKVDIKTFLETITFKIDDNHVDKPGELKISLREEAQLPNSSKQKRKEKSAVSYSTVIEPGDFNLTAKNRWDDQAEVNYVQLDWDKQANLSNDGYKLFQSIDGTNWKQRATKFNKAIKVLNIYPDLPASNTLKTWMDGLNLTDKDGNNLIQVTSVSISNYNINPDKYLYNSETGEYQYSVLMFGSWDYNRSLDLNELSYNATEKFYKTGRGILFGHDTVVYVEKNSKLQNPNFMKFASKMGIGPVGKGEYGSSGIKIINDGYLMKFPFEMKNGQKLKVPVTHSINPILKKYNNKWIEFTSGTPGTNFEHIYDTPEETNNWYLITENNIGMIQTGHSNGASTIDERKIIANTLYNLAQVTMTNSGTDYSVKDDVSPQMTTIERDMDNQIVVDGKDIGKKYQYYVEANTKDKGLLKSDVVEEEVISNLKGYIYILDDVPTTVPPVVKDEYGKVTNINAPVINPEVSTQSIIKGVTNKSQWLHILPIDRANNVGKVKHIQIEEIPYEKTPAIISCLGIIPQKIYVRGVDTFDLPLLQGNQVIETKLQVGQDVIVNPLEIPNYEFIHLLDASNKEVTTKNFTISGTKQDIDAVYRRLSIKVHLRQEVLSPNKTVVIPKQGYLSITHRDLMTGDKFNRLTVPVNSTDESNGVYTTYDIEITDDLTLMDIKTIVPMYYDLVGYVTTTTSQEHNSANAQPTFTPIDVKDHQEIWVTTYVKPNVTDSAFYGWGYNQNIPYTVHKP